MIDLRSRVRARLDELNRNPFDAARIGGLNKHFVDDLLIGKKETVKETSLPKLAKALDWTVGELLGGGEAIEAGCNADFEAVPSAGILRNGVFFYDRDGIRLDFPAGSIREVDTTAGMGGGQEAQFAYEDEGDGNHRQVDAFKPEPWIFPRSFLDSGIKAPASAVLAIATQGDSMAPTISHGDVVLIDTRHLRISPPGIYALRDIYGEIIVKRLDIFRSEGCVIVKITSDNPHEPTREEPASEVAIVGRVCGIVKIT